MLTYQVGGYQPSIHQPILKDNNGMHQDKEIFAQEEEQQVEKEPEKKEPTIGEILR